MQPLLMIPGSGFMVMIENQRKGPIYGRLLLCLLLAVIFISRKAVTGSCEEAGQVMNTCGSMNTDLSVDPIENSEAFSAVLYNNRNGLPTSDANVIAQTGDGFLWIGSYAGLIRYDGNTFERINSTYGIANVRCMFVDSQDRLWIGTNDTGVFLMTKGSVRKWNRSDGLRSASVRAITEDEDGRIYISCASAGIATIDTGLNLTLIKDDRLDGQTVPEFRRGSDGLVYGITQKGDVFTLIEGEVADFLDDEENPVKNIHSIMPDPAHPGFLYLGTTDSEIYYGKMAEKFASPVVYKLNPLAAVNSMEYINGQIWICAGNGIGKLGQDGIHSLGNVPMNNSVEHVMIDYEGNLWFSSSHQGIMKIVRNQFLDLFEKYGLPPVVVNSTCMNGDELFIGTDSGLIVIDKGKLAQSVPLKKAVTASGKELGATDLLEFLDGVRIRSIVRDSRGRLWIPTWRKYGLLRYDKGEIMAFTREDGLFSDMIRVVCECKDGTILAANAGGVSVIQDDRVTGGRGVKDGITNGDILTVTEGFNHEWILGSDGDGIYIISPDGIKHIGTEDGLGSDIILRVKRSENRNVYWIVTGNSLAFMTPDYQVTKVREFPYPNNYDLYESKMGDLWILSSAGIYVISDEELLKNGPITPVFYGMSSGLPYIASANALSELTADGDLYIASTEGVVRVNIDTPFEDISEVKAGLPFIDADNERFYPDETGEFNLPANARKITIYPFVFTYSMTDPKVSYRLAGFDTKDVTVSRSRLLPVDYTNLKIGSYEFIMKIEDDIGDKEQTVSFRIVKGKELSVEAAGTLLLNVASLFILAGILLYTSVYRKRGRLEDRLFFNLIMANAALTAGEVLSFLLEYINIPLVRELMIAGNTVFYIFLVVFPYLLSLYFDYNINPDRQYLRKKKILYSIPCLLFFAVMIINLKTGWIFSIGRRNTFHQGSGRRFFVLLLPLWIYLLVSLIKAFRVNIRLCVLGCLLIGTHLIWSLWVKGISSVSFIYTLILVIIHLYVLTKPLNEDGESIPV